jgi:hypothetical protein
LVDTGASCSFLNFNTIKKLKLEYSNVQEVSLANNFKLKVKFYNLKMKNLGMKEYCNVSLGELEQNILGNDYMNAFGVNLSYDMKSLGLNIEDNFIDDYDDSNSLFLIRKVFKDYDTKIFDCSDFDYGSVNTTVDSIGLGLSGLNQKSCLVNHGSVNATVDSVGLGLSGLNQKSCHGSVNTTVDSIGLGLSGLNQKSCLVDHGSVNATVDSIGLGLSGLNQKS